MALSNEMMAGASITQDQSEPLFYSAEAAVIGSNTTIQVFQGDISGQKGKSIAQWSLKPTSRPYYQVQEMLRARGSKVKTAWTQLYAFQIPYIGEGARGNAGLSQTRPITYCGDYSCMQGIVSADVLLETTNIACQAAWENVRDTLNQSSYDFAINASDSAVFIVVSYSEFFPDQEGVLIGMSHHDPGFSSDHITPATASSSSVVRQIGGAMLDRYGTWRNVPNTSSMPLFSFELNEMASGHFAACNSEDVSVLTNPRVCLQVATKTFTLDESLQWMVVMGLPAMAFSKEATEMKAETQKQVVEKEKLAQETFHTMVTIIVCVATFVTVFSACLGILVARAVSNPLKQLGLRMHRLESLDTTMNASALTFRARNRVHIQEIQEVNEGFFRLTRSIKGFARFVPETVVQNMVSGDRRKRGLHVDSRVVTIMFSDVKDFTSIAENLSAQDLILTLYMYLTEMTRIVERFEGVVSEILGDGLLVFWNTPNNVENHPAKACAAALAQQQGLSVLNEHLAGLTLPQLSIRVGIHTGKVLAGNIGSEKKMKFGCIGDPINLASRLEGLCKYYGVSSLCSGYTKVSLPPNLFALRKLDLVQVKGKREPTWVYELMGHAGAGGQAAAGIQTPPCHPTATDSTRSATSFGLLALPTDSHKTGAQSRPSPRSQELAPVQPAIFCSEPLLPADPVQCRLALRYEQALIAFHEGRMSDADAGLDALLRDAPEDKAAILLLERVRARVRGGPQDPNWSPVLQMTHK